MPPIIKRLEKNIMELIINPNKISDIYTLNEKLSLLLPLESFATDYKNYFTLEEIKLLKEKYPQRKIYIVINKMIFNHELETLSEILITLNNLNLSGIFFYDLSILELKTTLNLSIDLIWNATHMVTNYKTCNFYYEKGVKYAHLSNEITLDEILEIKQNSKIIPIITLLAYPTVATSRRKLITNYNKVNNYENTPELVIEETITKEKYTLLETKDATSFKLNKPLNITSILNELLKQGFTHFIVSQENIESDAFKTIINILQNSLSNKLITNEDIKTIETLVGNNTGFLHKKTIYKVKG